MESPGVVIVVVVVAAAAESISVYSQPPRSTQPGHPSVGRLNEYHTSQRAVMLCSWGLKAGMVREWMAGKTVWNPSYHGPYLSTLALGLSQNGVLYKCPITLSLTNCTKLMSCWLLAFSHVIAQCEMRQMEFVTRSQKRCKLYNLYHASVDCSWVDSFPDIVSSEL